MGLWLWVGLFFLSGLVIAVGSWWPKARVVWDAVKIFFRMMGKHWDSQKEFEKIIQGMEPPKHFNCRCDPSFPEDHYRGCGGGEMTVSEALNRRMEYLDRRSVEMEQNIENGLDVEASRIRWRAIQDEMMRLEGTPEGDARGVLGEGIIMTEEEFRRRIKEIESGAVRGRMTRDGLRRITEEQGQRLADGIGRMMKERNREIGPMEEKVLVMEKIEEMKRAAERMGVEILDEEMLERVARSMVKGIPMKLPPIAPLSQIEMEGLERMDLIGRGLQRVMDALNDGDPGVSLEDEIGRAMLDAEWDGKRLLEKEVKDGD